MRDAVSKSTCAPSTAADMIALGALKSAPLTCLTRLAGKLAATAASAGRARGAAGDLVALDVPRLDRRVLVALHRLDPRLGGAEQLIGRDDLVDQALGLGDGRLHARALDEDVHDRVLDAEHPDGAGDAATAGEQAEGDLGQADLVATVRRDAVVTRERDLEAAAECGAVDGRDDGLADASRACAASP